MGRGCFCTGAGCPCALRFPSGRTDSLVGVLGDAVEGNGQRPGGLVGGEGGGGNATLLVGRHSWIPAPGPE